MPTRLGTRCVLVSAADVSAGSGSLITRSAEAKLMWIRPGPNRCWPQASSAPEKLGSCQYLSLATAGRAQVFDKTFYCFCTGNLTLRRWRADLNDLKNRSHQQRNRSRLKNV